MRCWIGPLAALCLCSALPLQGQTAKAGVNLILPTENDALFRNDGEAFYQHIERDYQGVKSTPWEGGRYGFVRDPMETAKGLVYTRFHEGIDIRPVHRDENGEPTDEIHVIADGKVVHVNPVPGYSNYGRYVVVEHHWDGCSYYSLYGHLSTVRVTPGQEVRQGDVIAVMGYTGVGINRERAHVHLELNLLLSHIFESWHDTLFKNDPNHNGIYNGLNLTGLDIARLYLALRKNPEVTIPQFLEGEEVFYKVRLPRSKNFELPKRYPWMVQAGGETGAKSWEVSFTRSGFPLRIEPSSVPVKEAELSFVQKSPVDYTHLTIGRVTGHNGQGALTESGRQYMRLLTWPD